jgi:hypothetical protein
MCQDSTSVPVDTMIHRKVTLHRVPVVLRVTGQVVFGVLGGGIGAITGRIHPAIGGVGWTVGSAFGVFALGDGGTHRGSYLWTLAAGAGTILAWTPALVNARGIEAIGPAIGAGFTSLIAEIVVYHVTEEDPADQKVSVDVIPGILNNRSVGELSCDDGWSVTVRIVI